MGAPTDYRSADCVRSTCVAIVVLVALGIACSQSASRAEEGPRIDRAQTDHPLDWFHEAKSGIMLHYLANPLEASGAGKGIVLKDGEWDRQIDAFDVDGLADQLQDIGADYLVISVGQNTGYYCSPNATYDKIVGITPSKCSRRDLVVDLSKALKARGIRLIVYLPSGAPANDPIAVKKLKWRWKSGERLAEFQRHWEAVIREWSLRWGTHVAGWWIDGCYFADKMYRFDEAPNFASFAAALRAGNPDAIITFNKPGQADSPHEDYTAGELWVKGREVSVCPGRWVKCDGKRLQYHALTFLGSGWGVGDAPRYSTDDLINYTRRVTDGGGVMTWDVPCRKNGLLEPGFVKPLKTLHAALAKGGGNRGTGNRGTGHLMKNGMIDIIRLSSDRRLGLTAR